MKPNEPTPINAATGPRRRWCCLAALLGALALGAATLIALRLSE
jgi:hypothetical protein